MERYIADARRVVVTGMGIVSPIGNHLDTVCTKLMLSESGITASTEMKERGFKSQVHGQPTCNWKEEVPRSWARFMRDGIGWAYVAAQSALLDAGLDSFPIESNERVGIIVGSGGPSVRAVVDAAIKSREKMSSRVVGPFAVPPSMSSGVSGVLGTAFGIKGVNFSITSACATSAHCIGEAALKIMSGQQSVMIAGGCEELDPDLSVLFDAMGAMSSKYNETPKKTPKAYDKNRDGFVIAGGAGMLILEELNHAKARGARVYAEVAGYGATSDGFDMVQPSGPGAIRCMKMALRGLHRPVFIESGDNVYLNAHGTATTIGDEKEIEAVGHVFGSQQPFISSTKSLTGHSLGAAGAWESIFSILAIDRGFVPGSANIDEIDPKFAHANIARKSFERRIDTAISNSFGFGGTNACLIFRRV